MEEKPGSGGRGRTQRSKLTCTFCGRSQSEVRKLAVGPSAYICDACVRLADAVVSSGRTASTPLGPVCAVPAQEAHACSFCGKPRYRVVGLAAMPAEAGGRFSGPASICSECLDLCNQSFAEERP